MRGAWLALRGSHVEEVASEQTSELTISTHLQIDDIANTDIDHSEESLILLFELLLIEDLNRKNAVFVDSPAPIPLGKTMSRTQVETGLDNHIQIEWLIPIWVQCLLDY